MGAKEAALAVLKENSPDTMTTNEIYEAMSAGGWTTGSTKPASNVSATLSQMRDAEVIKIGEGWKLKTAGSTLEILNSAQDATDQVVQAYLRPTASLLPASQ
jgi:hypothetical protein